MATCEFGYSGWIRAQIGEEHRKMICEMCPLSQACASRVERKNKKVSVVGGAAGSHRCLQLTLDARLVAFFREAIRGDFSSWWVRENDQTDEINISV